MKGSGLDCAEAVRVDAGPRRLRDMPNRILRSVCCVMDFIASPSTLKINFWELRFQLVRGSMAVPNRRTTQTTSALERRNEHFLGY
jgi:hypothetical protein